MTAFLIACTVAYGLGASLIARKLVKSSFATPQHRRNPRRRRIIVALLAVAYALIIVMAFYWRGACFGALNLLAADIAVLA
ncbi:hypothetical protein J7M28_06945, partial [bacterium]|nr:hypothetical protein [bacterium]